MPINQALLLCSVILSGLILLDESQFYSWGELMQLVASSMIVILGIYVLTLKQSSIVQVQDTTQD